MQPATKKEYFSIPNLLCYLRILLIPVFSILYLTADSPRDYWLAATIVLFSSLTDLIDGKIARRFHMITRWGKIIDPIADKLSHAALAFCLTTRHPLMWGLIGLMILKEGFMAVMGLHFLRHGQMLNGAMWFGKICTATLFIGLLVLFVFGQLPIAVANALICIMMIVMALALCLYVPVFRKMASNQR